MEVVSPTSGVKPWRSRSIMIHGKDLRNITSLKSSNRQAVLFDEDMRPTDTTGGTKANEVNRGGPFEGSSPRSLSNSF